MKLSFGQLIFEVNDRLNVEDYFGHATYIAKKGNNCGKCEFSTICSKKNPKNTFAHFCQNTHFVLEKGFSKI